MLYAFSVSVITAGGDVCGDVVLALLSAGFNFLALLFNHTMMTMMMTIMTTSSTASTDTATPATIPGDDPLVVVDLLC